MKHWIAFGLACAGCGDVENKRQDAAVQIDTSTPIDVAIDSPPPPPCDVTKAFGTAQLVPGVNTGNDERFGWLSADELTIYFSDVPVGSANRSLLFMTRASTSDAFANSAPIPGVNTTNTEERPTVTADGLQLFAESNEFGGDVDIVVATRASASASFSALSEVATINDATGNDSDVWISADGLTIYFASNRTAATKIYRSTRSTSTTTFAVASEVTELNTMGANGGAVLSADGLEVFFTSDRAGGASGLDVWRAIRTTPTGTFATPTVVTELQTNDTEFPSWVSPDRCRLFITSDRLGSYDIFVATRPQ